MPWSARKAATKRTGAHRTDPILFVQVLRHFKSSGWTLICSVQPPPTRRRQRKSATERSTESLSCGRCRPEAIEWEGRRCKGACQAQLSEWQPFWCMVSAYYVWFPSTRSTYSMLIILHCKNFLWDSRPVSMWLVKVYPLSYPPASQSAPQKLVIGRWEAPSNPKK